jgi:hypothetical protein
MPGDESGLTTVIGSYRPFFASSLTLHSGKKKSLPGASQNLGQIKIFYIFLDNTSNLQPKKHLMYLFLFIISILA